MKLFLFLLASWITIVSLTLTLSKSEYRFLVFLYVPVFLYLFAEIIRNSALSKMFFGLSGINRILKMDIYCNQFSCSPGFIPVGGEFLVVTGSSTPIDSTFVHNRSFLPVYDGGNFSINIDEGKVVYEFNRITIINFKGECVLNMIVGDDFNVALFYNLFVHLSNGLKIVRDFSSSNGVKFCHHLCIKEIVNCIVENKTFSVFKNSGNKRIWIMGVPEKMNAISAFIMVVVNLFGLLFIKEKEKNIDRLQVISSFLLSFFVLINSVFIVYKDSRRLKRFLWVRMRFIFPYLYNCKKLGGDFCMDTRGCPGVFKPRDKFAAFKPINLNSYGLSKVKLSSDDNYLSGFSLKIDEIWVKGDYIDGDADFHLTYDTGDRGFCFRVPCSIGTFSRLKDFFNRWNRKEFSCVLEERHDKSFAHSYRIVEMIKAFISEDVCYLKISEFEFDCMVLDSVSLDYWSRVLGKNPNFIHRNVKLLETLYHYCTEFMGEAGTGSLIAIRTLSEARIGFKKPGFFKNSQWKLFLSDLAYLFNEMNAVKFRVSNFQRKPVSIAMINSIDKTGLVYGHSYFKILEGDPVPVAEKKISSPNYPKLPSYNICSDFVINKAAEEKCLKRLNEFFPYPVNNEIIRERMFSGQGSFIECKRRAEKEYSERSKIYKSMRLNVSAEIKEVFNEMKSEIRKKEYFDLLYQYETYFNSNREELSNCFRSSFISFQNFDAETSDILFRLVEITSLQEYKKAKKALKGKYMEAIDLNFKNHLKFALSKVLRHKKIGRKSEAALLNRRSRILTEFRSGKTSGEGSFNLLFILKMLGYNCGCHKKIDISNFNLNKDSLLYKDLMKFEGKSVYEITGLTNKGCRLASVSFNQKSSEWDSEVKMIRIILSSAQRSLGDGYMSIGVEEMFEMYKKENALDDVKIKNSLEFVMKDKNFFLSVRRKNSIAT